MRYCERCGTGHDCVTEADEEKARVAIVRLETQRDIEVARINASAAKDIAETEAENSAEHAEGVAEGMETVLEAASGDTGEPETGEPIMVDMPPEEPEPEPAEPDSAPPEVVEVAEPAASKRSGYWDAYR